MVAMVEAKAMDGRLKGLPVRTRFVLWVMASNAHDTGNETTPMGCYFRGWEHLAICMGYDGLDANGERAVATAVSQLVAAGLIEKDDMATLDRRKITYRLHLL